jgi:predicted metalloprotease with PDZ domain
MVVMGDGRRKQPSTTEPARPNELVAGANKGGNYDLIYSGGTTLAAALDVVLRERTNGARGVPQLMARMYADFRRTHHAYNYQDVVRTASAVAGSEMAGFFARYVTGTSTIPLEAYLASAGLSVTRNKSTVVISRSPTISTSQANLLSALLAH